MKAQGYATLKRKLDKVFSEYIRRRFSDGDGNVPCCSCGAVKPWKKQQAGHFVTRVRLATRWDIENSAAQCSKCNVLLRGNAVGYARWLQDRYGQDIFTTLQARSTSLVKFRRADLREMIEDFKNKIKRIGT